MITRTLLIFASALSVAACDSEPDGPIRVAPTTIAANAAPTATAPAPEPEPEPVTIDLPKEANAIQGLQALNYISDDITLLVATGNPTELAELVGGEPPEKVEFGPHHAPELQDLHPSRIEAMGFDPSKPVGIAIRGAKGEMSIGTSWVVFATLKDEAKFRDAFALEKLDKTNHYPPPAGDKRHFFRLDNDEIVIAARSKTEETPKPLGQDDSFKRMTQALDFGHLATVFVRSRRSTSLSGFGLTEQGAAVKVLSEDDIEASSTRIKFPEYLAGTYPELPYLQRIINLRAEMDPAGRSMRAQITELERAPRERRLDAARDALKDIEEIASAEDKTIDQLFVATRLWKFTKSDVSDLYDTWLAMGMTEDELQQLEDLKTTLETMVVGTNFTADEINKLAEGAIGEQAREMSQNLGKNPEGAMGGLGGMAGMIGGLMGGDEDGDGDSKSSPLGMLGGLGNMMGGLGGGGGSDYDVNVSSKSPHLRNHGKRRVRALAMCWARSSSIEKDIKASAKMDLDAEGNVTLKKLTGVPADMKKCTTAALELRTVAPGEPVSGTVGFHFTHKK